MCLVVSPLLFRCHDFVIPEHLFFRDMHHAGFFPRRPSRDTGTGRFDLTFRRFPIRGYAIGMFNLGCEQVREVLIGLPQLVQNRRCFGRFTLGAYPDSVQTLARSNLRLQAHVIPFGICELAETFAPSLLVSNPVEFLLGLG